MKDSQKKILFVLQNLELGGAEQLKIIIEKYLAKEKYSITYCCIRKTGVIGNEIIKIGGDVVTFNSNDKFYNFFATYRLYKIVKKVKPDLIHSSLFNANFHARIVGILTNIPVITEEHGMYIWKRWYHIAIDRLLARFTYKIIAPSYSVKDFIIKQEKIKPAKIIVIYNPIDVERLKSNTTRIEARKSLNIDECDFVIGVVGNLRKEKGHSILLQAYKTVISKYRNVKLFIIGYGPLYGKLRNLSKDLKIEDNVTFMGKLTNIADFLKSLDLFVMPSLNEGFGIALIEAIYMKVPCIACNVGGIKEIAEQFPMINLIDPNNPEILSKAIMNQIINRTEFKISISDYNDMKKVFTPKFYVNKLENLYDEL